MVWPPGGEPGTPEAEEAEEERQRDQNDRPLLHHADVAHPVPIRLVLVGPGGVPDIPRHYLTYWRFPYQTLPPLPTPDPSYRYLAPHDDTVTPEAALEASRAWLSRQMAMLTDAAARLHMTFPESFMRFMLSPELQACIRQDCCGFMLSNLLVPCPGFEDGYLVAFLRDQQDCLLWCLCLTVEGESCVVAVPSEVLDAIPTVLCDALLGMLEPDQIDGSAEAISTWSDSDERDASWEAARASGGICICAPSFPTFIYRFWLETEIALKLNGDDQTPLTDVERGYVDDYVRQKHLGD